MKTSLSFVASAIRDAVSGSNTHVWEKELREDVRIVFVKYHETIIFAGLFVGPDLFHAYFLPYPTKTTRKRLNAISRVLDLKLSFFSEKNSNVVQFPMYPKPVSFDARETFEPNEFTTANEINDGFMYEPKAKPFPIQTRVMLRKPPNFVTQDNVETRLLDFTF